MEMGLHIESLRSHPAMSDPDVRLTNDTGLLVWAASYLMYEGYAEYALGGAWPYGVEAFQDRAVEEHLEAICVVYTTWSFGRCPN